MLKVKNREHLESAMMFSCGNCLPCKINKSRIWTHRMLLEQSTAPDSTFLTLTQKQDLLGPNASLIKKDIQDFLKRLRRIMEPIPLRYFTVGEYGEEKFGPHYHMALYNIGPAYKEEIEKAWCTKDKPEHGFVMAGTITQASARYITGYVIKNMTWEGDKRLNGRQPEFTTMSRRPAIGTKAIKRVSEKMKKSKYVDEKKYYVTELQHGSKKLPLGRTLSNKLAMLNKVDTRLTDEINLAITSDMIDEALIPGMDFYNSVIETYESKRKSLEKRHKIWSKRR